MVRGDELYLDGFDKLSTERHVGNSIGPIPWSKIALYGEKKKLDYAMSGVFEYVIHAMDRAYLKWAGDRQERQASQAKAKASAKK